MKKILSLILIAVMMLTFAACGSAGSDLSEDTAGSELSDGTAELPENYIITTSEMAGCTLVTTYIFDDDMKLTGVSQKADYTDSSRMSLEYAMVESDTSNFTDLAKDGDSFTCKLTEKGIASFYPDATYDSILSMAKEQELKVESSK